MGDKGKLRHLMYFIQKVLFRHILFLKCGKVFVEGKDRKMEERQIIFGN